MCYSNFTIKSFDLKIKPDSIFFNFAETEALTVSMELYFQEFNWIMIKRITDTM